MMTLLECSNKIVTNVNGFLNSRSKVWIQIWRTQESNLTWCFCDMKVVYYIYNGSALSEYDLGRWPVLWQSPPGWGYLHLCIWDTIHHHLSAPTNICAPHPYIMSIITKPASHCHIYSTVNLVWIFQFSIPKYKFRWLIWSSPSKGDWI